MIEHRGYYIKAHKSFPNNFVIVTEGKGGSIPDIMKGLYTSYPIAKSLIDKYLEESDKVKRKPYARKERTTSGD